MAIITRDEVKEILQITTTNYDSLIETLIPLAEGTFLKIRGREFFELKEVSITTGSPIIKSIDAIDYREIRLQDRIKTLPESATDMDGTVIVLDNDNLEITLDSNATATDSDVDMIVYPRGSKYAAAKIVGYMLSKQNATGLQSEKIGTYSYAKFDNATGIPMDIVNLIERYQSTH
jgi:hypothetical protein